MDLVSTCTNSTTLLLIIVWIMNVVRIPTKIPVIKLVEMVTNKVTRKIISCSLPMLKVFLIFSGEANL